MKRTGLIYLGVLLLFVGLIVWRVARDEADADNRAALFLERCRLEAAESDCQAALSERGLPCQTTWYGAEPPASDRWSGYYTCVRGPQGKASH